MKTFRLSLISLLFNLCSYGQPDPLLEYKSHKFSCDTAETTPDLNFCSGVKRDFADSLLNNIYKKIIDSINSEITDDQNKLKLELVKKDTSISSKEMIEFLKNDIDYTKRLKESIIKSQVEWIKLRDLNVDVVSIQSEGGTGFVAEENQSLIDDTLERIKKLKSFYYIDQ